MQPEIIEIEDKKLVGMRLEMSLEADKTRQLFSAFMPRRHEVDHRLNHDVFDLKVYPQNFFTNISLSSIYSKWALVEVSKFDELQLPAGMEAFHLKGGIYAVFDLKKMESQPNPFAYIFNKWLPESGNILENRPHFDLLKNIKKKNDPDREEEIWIPIQ